MRAKKVKYSHVNHHSTETRNGKQYLYFTVHSGEYFEWQRGAQTINTKASPHYESRDLECFSLDYTAGRPTMRHVKSSIVDFLNHR